MERFFFLFLAFIFLTSCSNQNGTEAQDELNAESIIQKSVDFHFGKNDPSFSFSFRGRSYSIKYAPNKFKYICEYTDSLGAHKRVLNNKGYNEYLDGYILNLPAKDSISHGESVNSVCYFNLLPLTLQEPAVNAELMGMESIENKTYHKLQIGFDQNGGGVDFQDIYYYWLDTADYSLDYLAYSFVDGNGGTRFRKAMNQRKINGIRVQDYLNFKGPSAPDSLAFIKDLFLADQLKVLSKIEVTEIRVN